MDRSIDVAERGILLVEDSPEDAEAIIRAFRQAGIDNPITHLTDGDATIAYFNDLAHQRFGGGRPVMVLLDLNLPGTDGRDILTRLKSDYATKDIPVLVLTSSANERDITACYLAGANSYLQKPVDYRALLHTAEMILKYWFNLVLVPPLKGARA